MKKAMLALLLIMAMAVSLCSVAEEMVAVPAEMTSGSDDMPYTPEELYEIYASRELGLISGFSMQNNREKLTAMEQVVYDALKSDADQVAAGERSSVQFEIDPEAIGMKMHWTAEEIGEAITLDRLRAVMQEYYQGKLDIIRAILAVINDHPYSFYWNDHQYRFSLPWDIALQYNSMEAIIVGKIIVEFEIDMPYMGEDTLHTDTSKTGATRVAVDNAHAILDNASSMGSDMAKMTYYMQQIRSLSEYNHEAADPE